METHHFSETIIPGKGQVHIQVDVGEITILPHNQSDTVLVDATVNDVDVTVHRQGETIFVRAERREESGIAGKIGRLLNNDYKTELTVHVPTDCAVNAKAATGKIHVSGLSAPVDTFVVTGQTQLHDLGGPVRAKAVTGQVKYAGDLTAVNHRFETVTGSVHLNLNPNLNARLDTQTTTGHLRCQLPLSDRQDRNFLTGSRVKGTAGAGTGHIKARVVTGQLIVESNAIKDKPVVEKEI